jgi:hypothetical protein
MFRLLRFIFIDCNGFASTEDVDCHSSFSGKIYKIIVMKFLKIITIFAFLTTSCAVNEQVFENQISANSNKTATVNQNTNNQNAAKEFVKKEVDYYAHIKPEHRQVLREWLKTKPYFRPGVEEIDDSMFHEDAYQDKTNFKKSFEGNMKFLRETVGENGYQYYAVGDMNHDRKEDFAVLLVDTRKPGKYSPHDEFALAIFNAPFKKGQRPSYFEEGLYGVTNSYIVFDKLIEKYLFLGKFESDALCATYYPRNKTYYFKDCLD